MAQKNATEVKKELAEKGVELVEFIYHDFAGTYRGKTMLLSEIGSHLEDGMGITKAQPASTIRDEIVNVAGLTPVGEYRLVPDLNSMQILPYAPTVATFMCDYYTEDGQPLVFDSRVILQKVVKQFNEQGLFPVMTIENEFDLYEKAEDGNMVPYRPDVCFSTASMDDVYTFLPELLRNLRAVGITPVEYYPEAGAGQHELPVAPTMPIIAADNEVRFKRIVKRTFAQHGLAATFAPKPNLETAGSGAHIHLSLWNQEHTKNVLYQSDDPLKLSQLAYHFIGGLMEHINGLCALTCASVNSYQRLQPGQWSSAYAVFGRDNREAAVRIPSIFAGAKADSLNIELKVSDATANVYLALAGILAAGLDGIKQQAMPDAQVDVDPATLSEQERQKRHIKRLPSSLDQALEALKTDPLFEQLLTPTGLQLYTGVKEADVEYYASKSAAEIAESHRKFY